MLREQTPDALWEAILAFEGAIFYTARGLEYWYTIRGNEMFVSRKEKSVTRASILVAYKKAQELGCVTGPKQLGVFGASYLYPVFLEAGDYLRQCWLISCPEKQDADAGVQPQHQDHDGGQAAVHIRIITEIVEVDGKSVGTSDPSDGGNQRTGKLETGYPAVHRAARCTARRKRASAAPAQETSGD